MLETEKIEAFRLKGEMLRLASAVVRRDGGDICTYMLTREELDRESEAVQCQILNMQIHTLNSILSSKRNRGPEGSAGQRPKKRCRRRPTSNAAL